jgi:outer membrane receptor protein involved in Fe transport
MTIKITAFFAAWLTIASTFVSAQTGLTLSGKINAENNKPMDGATVYLKKAADSVLVKTALADAEGNFIFENLKTGDFKITITMVGYRSYKSDTIRLKQSTALPAIVLQQSGTMLKEVGVSSHKPFVEHLVDRTVVNVDALISNAGSSAMDVLEKSPGVLVDQNGTVSLKGKDVKIFIDDKPTYLAGADLENYLRSLPSSTLDQIELMTNPPAKYDAAGSGGIINIRLKRSKVKGFNGGLNLSYMQGQYARTNNSFNFNYRDNKLNVFGNLSYSGGDNFNDLYINRHFFNPDGSPASNFLQHTYITRRPHFYNAKLGLDYYVSDKTTFGIGFTGLLNTYNNPTTNTSRLLDAQNTLDSTVVADSRGKYNFKNMGVNLNYRHQYDKKGRELTADVDYLNYNSSTRQSFLNNTYLPDGTLTNSDLLTGTLPSNINIFAAKTDYTHPLSNGIKLSAGLKTSYTKTDNIADYFNTVASVTTPDYDETNHFIYKEQINAAYINASKDFKRFSVQAGLRFENTISNGHQLGNIEKPDSLFKRNYNGLFPTLYLQYKLDTAGSQTLGLNYGRRIDRPYYQDLNPFLSPLDKFTYYTGNPFLKPSYTQSLELSHTWKNITTTLSYSKTGDDVDETIEIVNGIYYSRPGNIGNTVVKGVSVDASFDPAKWLNIHFFGLLQNIHTVSNFYTGLLNTQGTFGIINPVLQFKMGNDWTLQADGNYRSKLTSAQFVLNPRKRLNAAVSKKLSASTTLKLAANDIFHSFVNSGTINNLADTKADYHNIGDSRNIAISFSYRFGKAISDQRKHGDNAAESEQNRVKN